MSEKEKTNKKWTSSADYRGNYDNIFKTCILCNEKSDTRLCEDCKEKEFLLICPTCGYQSHGDTCPNCNSTKTD